MLQRQDSNPRRENIMLKTYFEFWTRTNVQKSSTNGTGWLGRHGDVKLVRKCVWPDYFVLLITNRIEKKLVYFIGTAQHCCTSIYERRQHAESSRESVRATENARVCVYGAEQQQQQIIMLMHSARSSRPYNYSQLDV